MYLRWRWGHSVIMIHVRIVGMVITVVDSAVVVVIMVLMDFSLVTVIIIILCITIAVVTIPIIVIIVIWTKMLLMQLPRLLLTTPYRDISAVHVTIRAIASLLVVKAWIIITAAAYWPLWKHVVLILLNLIGMMLLMLTEMG